MAFSEIVVCLVPVMSGSRIAVRSAKAASSGGRLKSPSRITSCSKGAASWTAVVPAVAYGVAV